LPLLGVVQRPFVQRLASSSRGCKTRPHELILRQVILLAQPPPPQQTPPNNQKQ